MKGQWVDEWTQSHEPCSWDSLEHVATYFVGAMGGAAAVAAVNALVMPSKKTEKPSTKAATTKKKVAKEDKKDL